MIATARRCGAAFMVVLAAALVFMAAPPAYSEDTKAGSGQASDGSAQISVSVTYESAASGSDGGGGIDPDRNSDRPAGVRVCVFVDRQRVCRLYARP